MKTKTSGCPLKFLPSFSVHGFFLKINSIILFMFVCVYICAQPGAFFQKLALDPLELELELVVSHCVGAGN